ncbi:hypothetical protein HO173_000008 [Letharia columbiana]|uniref:Uncharacterized protein n=1 Tax=Letharia columbiana TaxID=112416 RepID=A0A8H6G651_9LECA|nr:uncharacterized protein HO173_000008 [Letharia columbiana]KAF6241298.1 hypothetical protein HO173_000008 [Letharia columbiana]
MPPSLAHMESSLLTLQGSEHEDDGEDETEGSKQEVSTPAGPVSQADGRTPEALKEADSWGFVIYRMVYGNDGEWQTFKQKIWKHVERGRDAIVDARGDPDGVTFDFIEDEPELDGATAEQVRLRHAPSYVFPAVDPEAAEDQVVPSERDDGLCGAGFLMIGRDAMESVIRHPARGKPYVVAVDTINNHYEEGVFEGTMKIHADDFLTEYF